MYLDVLPARDLDAEFLAAIMRSKTATKHQVESGGTSHYAEPYISTPSLMTDIDDPDDDMHVLYSPLGSIPPDGTSLRMPSHKGLQSYDVLPEMDLDDEYSSLWRRSESPPAVS